MFRTQTEIIKKLNKLSLSTEVIKFINDIMNFYKNHISRLQNMMSSKKSKKIQNIKTENNYTEKIKFLRNYIAEAEDSNKEKLRIIFVLKKKYQSKIVIINNLKNELKTKDEKIIELEDNLNILKKQTDVVIEYNKSLKNNNSLNKSEFYPQNKNYFNETKSVINEIRNLKRELKNFEKQKDSRLRKNRSENLMKKSESKTIRFNNENIDQWENKSNFEISESKNIFMTRNNNLKKNLKKSFFDMSQDNPFLMPSHEVGEKGMDKFQNDVDIEEMKKYLDFLKNKEKKFQQDLWKYPYRGRNKLEKTKIFKIERNLHSLNKEIQKIRNIIRNKYI